MPCAPTGPSRRSTHAAPEACLGPCPATSAKLVHSAPAPALRPALCPSCPLKKRNGPAATQTGQPDLARVEVFFIERFCEGGTERTIVAWISRVLRGGAPRNF